MSIITEDIMRKWEGLCKSLDKNIGDEIYLNDCYLHPENYINNDKSKIKPGDYKTEK